VFSCGHQFAIFSGDQSRFGAAVKLKAVASSICREFRVMATIFLDCPPPTVARRALTEDDAVDIWIARWLRVRPVDLRRRYACDPRRLYEIWEETRFPGSRARALSEFEARFPRLEIRRDPGPHRRLAGTVGADQMSLFPDYS
jgi:hypothetical protein